MKIKTYKHYWFAQNTLNMQNKLKRYKNHYNIQVPLTLSLLFTHYSAACSSLLVAKRLMPESLLPAHG